MAGGLNLSLNFFERFERFFASAGKWEKCLYNIQVIKRHNLPHEIRASGWCSAIAFDFTATVYHHA